MEEQIWPFQNHKPQKQPSPTWNPTFVTFCQSGLQWGELTSGLYLTQTCQICASLARLRAKALGLEIYKNYGSFCPKMQRPRFGWKMGWVNLDDLISRELVNRTSLPNAVVSKVLGENNFIGFLHSGAEKKTKIVKLIVCPIFMFWALFLKIKLT